MTEYIYGDILFVINFSMDFVALFICGKIMRFRMNALRMALAATMGGIYGVTSLFIGLGAFADVALDMLVALSISFVAHYHGSVSKTVAATALFASVSMLMGGAMTALYSRIGRYQSYIMIGGNISTVFGEIPLWIFSILAAVSAFITFFLQKIMHRKVSVERCRIRLAFGDDVCEFDAFVDTGNCVQEPFSGNAIVFVSAPAAQRIGGKYGKMLFLTSESTDAFESGAVRFVPMNTVSGYALVSAVKPRNFEIEINRHFEPRSVFVACDVNARDYNGAEALVPSSLL